MTRSRAHSIEGGDFSFIHPMSLQGLEEKTLLSSIIAKWA